MSMRKRKFNEGDVVGKWTIIEYPYKSKKALLRCECGKEEWRWLSNLTSGKSSSCYDCRKTSPEIKTYAMVVRTAKRREINFDLTFETWLHVSQKDCIYCGESPSNDSYGFKYNGLDRVDSSDSYHIRNVMACCKYCNQAKSNQTLQQFAERSMRVAKTFDKKAIWWVNGEVWHNEVFEDSSDNG